MIEQACIEIADRARNQGYVLGMIIGIASVCITWYISTFPELMSKRNKMVKEIAKLTRHNKGVVTVYDLVAAAEVSPEKARKFLIELARKLDIEPEVEESTGTRFYRFVDGNRINRIEAEK